MHCAAVLFNADSDSGSAVIPVIESSANVARSNESMPRETGSSDSVGMPSPAFIIISNALHILTTMGGTGPTQLFGPWGRSQPTIIVLE